MPDHLLAGLPAWSGRPIACRRRTWGRAATCRFYLDAARRAGAEHVAAAEPDLRFPYRAVREGDELRLGDQPALAAAAREAKARLRRAPTRLEQGAPWLPPAGGAPAGGEAGVWMRPGRVRAPAISAPSVPRRPPRATRPAACPPDPEGTPAGTAGRVHAATGRVGDWPRPCSANVTARPCARRGRSARGETCAAPTSSSVSRS